MSGLVVNIGSPTGKTLSPYIYGFCGGGLCWGFNENNDFDVVNDAGFQASAKLLQPQLIRLNCQQTTGMLQNIFSGGVGNPNWAWLDAWINNHAGFFNDSTGRLVFGIGPLSGDTSIDAGTYASWATAVAAHFKSAGQECSWWEIGNECTALGPGTYCSYFTTISNALLGFNSNYKCGGPVSDYWDDGGNGAAMLSGGVPAANIGYIVWHAYGGGNATDLGTAIGQGVNYSNIGSIRSTVSGAGLGNIPLAVNEYNLSLNGGNSDFNAAMFSACFMTGCYQSDSNFGMGAIWDMVNSGGFAAIGNSDNGGNTSVITPQGYYLGYAGQNCGGTEYNVTGVPGSCIITATTSYNRWCVQIINYGGGDQTFNISFTGAPAPINPGAIQWSMNSSGTPQTQTLADPSSVNVPNQSIAIVTGTFPGAGPPNPTPTPGGTPTPTPAPAPVTLTTAATTASGGTTLTFTATTGAAVGQMVTGAGIATGTIVSSITSTTIVLSKPVTAAIPIGEIITLQSAASPTPTPTPTPGVPVPPGAVWTDLPTTTTTTATITGLKANTPYYLRVQAANASGSVISGAILQTTSNSATPTVVGTAFPAPTPTPTPTTPHPTPTPTTPHPTPTPTTPGESTQGATVTNTTGTITDASGNKWTLSTNVGTPGFYFVDENGAVVLGATWVVMLVYYNHVVYYEDQQGGAGAFNWYYWDATTKSWLGNSTGDPRGTTTPTPTGGESAQGTTVTGVTGSITDAQGNIWALIANDPDLYFITENGTTSLGATWVVMLLYYNHIVYYEDQQGGPPNANNWYWWDSQTSSWLGNSTGDPRGTPLPNSPSAQGAIVTDTSGDIVDNQGNVWTLVPNPPNYYFVAENGAVVLGSIYATTILYWNSTVYFQSSQTTFIWFVWNGSGWTQVVGDPRNTTTPIPLPAPTPSPIPLPAPSSNESPSGTTLTDPSQFIIDSNGNTWGLLANPPYFYFVAENGNIVSGATWVVEMMYVNHQVYYEDQQGGAGVFQWYIWTGGGWSAVAGQPQ